MIRTREEAIKQCEDFIENHSEWSVEVEWANGVEFVLEDYKRLIKQEPRKGYWLRRPHVYGVTYCSICDFELKIDNTNYCPNCGADMREVKE